MAEVVNQVLNELGRNAVPDYTQDQSGTLIAAKVDVLLPELLLRTDWNFAITYVVDSSPIIPPISPEYYYNYQLPPNYNRMDRISWFTINFGLVYRIIDNILMCNVYPIQYYYVIDNVDLGMISYSFYRALVLYTAFVTAMPITNDEKLAAYLKAEYKEKLIDAIRQNDMDRMVVSTPVNDFDRQTYI